jgi:beta-phosphoglucomutase-like phosphatase (HAD superfamily)
LQKTGLKPEECIVIEDSRNGVVAVKAAGMNVVATTNVYTEKEDLHEADIIVSCLGDPDGEKGELTYSGHDLEYNGVLSLDQLIKYFSA